MAFAGIHTKKYHLPAQVSNLNIAKCSFADHTELASFACDVVQRFQYI